MEELDPRKHGTSGWGSHDAPSKNWTGSLASLFGNVAYTAGVGGLAAWAFHITPQTGVFFTASMRISQYVIYNLFNSMGFCSSGSCVKKIATAATFVISTGIAALTATRVGFPITNLNGVRLNLATAATLYALSRIGK